MQCWGSAESQICFVALKETSSLPSFQLACCKRRQGYPIGETVVAFLLFTCPPQGHWPEHFLFHHRQVAKVDDGMQLAIYVTTITIYPHIGCI